MIKHIIFDLDGVLVDAREIHYEALNLALSDIDPIYEISREEHLSTYDGLPTKKKLEMLTIQKGLNPELHNLVWKKKQEKTLEVIDRMDPDIRMRNVLRVLKNDGYSVHVCSNSIKSTIKMMLVRRELIEFVDEIFQMKM